MTAIKSNAKQAPNLSILVIDDTVELFSSRAANGNDPTNFDKHRRRCIEDARPVCRFMSDGLKLLAILDRRFADIAQWLINNEDNSAFADTDSAQLGRSTKRIVSLIFSI